MMPATGCCSSRRRLWPSFQNKPPNQTHKGLMPTPLEPLPPAYSPRMTPRCSKSETEKLVHVEIYSVRLLFATCVFVAVLTLLTAFFIDSVRFGKLNSTGLNDDDKRNLLSKYNSYSGTISSVSRSRTVPALCGHASACVLRLIYDQVGPAHQQVVCSSMGTCDSGCCDLAALQPGI